MIAMWLSDYMIHNSYINNIWYNMDNNNDIYT